MKKLKIIVKIQRGWCKTSKRASRLLWKRI